MRDEQAKQANLEVSVSLRSVADTPIVDSTVGSASVADEREDLRTQFAKAAP